MGFMDDANEGNGNAIGFIGIGVMGKSMARHLLEAGHPLRVYTRTRSKAEPLLKRGAHWAESPAELTRQCRAVFTIVGYPRDVEEVYFGAEGLMSGLRPGTVLVDMTTSSPELAVRIAAAAKEAEGAALDAPVSGGEQGARAGTLSIMVGGDAKSFEQVHPLLKIMGENIILQGPAGSGQHCKLCNQMAIATNMIGVCEAMAYALKAGLDPDTVLRSISTGAAGSWSLSNLAPRMLKGDFDPGFFVRHFIKDMDLAVKAAQTMDFDTPGLKLALERYRELASKGHEMDGTQSLFRLYQS